MCIVSECRVPLTPCLLPLDSCYCIIEDSCFRKVFGLSESFLGKTRSFPLSVRVKVDNTAYLVDSPVSSLRSRFEVMDVVKILERDP